MKAAPGQPGPAERVVWQAASIMLSYPDEVAVSQTGLLRSALRESAPDAEPRLASLLGLWETTPLAELQPAYVETFDLSRRHALYLSYWTDGDTRRRGEVLAGFKARYRAHGWAPPDSGELPDFVPLVCEYAALADPVDGAALLQEYRSSLELLRLALAERSPAHAGVVAALCGTLPGPSPADRREVVARAAAGPPTEQVGLEPYDPRLLPLAGGR